MFFMLCIYPKMIDFRDLAEIEDKERLNLRLPWVDSSRSVNEKDEATVQEGLFV